MADIRVSSYFNVFDRKTFSDSSFARMPLAKKVAFVFLTVLSLASTGYGGWAAYSLYYVKQVELLSQIASAALIALATLINLLVQFATSRAYIHRYGRLPVPPAQNEPAVEPEPVRALSPVAARVLTPPPQVPNVPPPELDRDLFRPIPDAVKMRPLTCRAASQRNLLQEEPPQPAQTTKASAWDKLKGAVKGRGPKVFTFGRKAGPSPQQVEKERASASSASSAASSSATASLPCTPAAAASSPLHTSRTSPVPRTPRGRRRVEVVTPLALRQMQLKGATLEDALAASVTPPVDDGPQEASFNTVEARMPLKLGEHGEQDIRLSHKKRVKGFFNSYIVRQNLHLKPGEWLYGENSFFEALERSIESQLTLEAPIRIGDLQSVLYKKGSASSKVEGMGVIEGAGTLIAQKYDLAICCAKTVLVSGHKIPQVVETWYPAKASDVRIRPVYIGAVNGTFFPFLLTQDGEKLRTPQEQIERDLRQLQRKQRSAERHERRHSAFGGFSDLTTRAQPLTPSYSRVR